MEGTRGFLKSDVLFEALKLRAGAGATLHKTQRQGAGYHIDTGIKGHVLRGLSKIAARHYLRVFPKMVMGPEVRALWGLA